MTEPDFYTIRQAAAVCHITEPTARRKIAAYVPKDRRYLMRRKVDGVKQRVTVLTPAGVQRLTEALHAEQTGLPLEDDRMKSALFNRTRAIRTVESELNRLSDRDLRLVERLIKRLNNPAGA